MARGAAEGQGEGCRVGDGRGEEASRAAAAEGAREQREERWAWHGDC